LYRNCAKPGKKSPSITPENPRDCEKDFLELLSLHEGTKGKLVDVLKESADGVFLTPKESV